ncbi:anti-sigma-I factor RsgI family protein [Aureibacillus halotolerans]|nr:hypothetical protein [Aureibacillus halotolerans]
MDLKASLEASLNDSMQVISWTPIPPTDETFVDEMNLTPFISFTLFAQKYLAASKKQGHLQEQPEVLMSLTMVDEQKDAQAFRMTIQNEMEKLSNSEVVQEPIAVTTMSTNNERRMEALEKGVSPAKYMLFLSASRHQVPFTLQEFKALSFKEIKKQLANSKETAWPWSVANTPEKNLIIEATP